MQGSDKSMSNTLENLSNELRLNNVLVDMLSSVDSTALTLDSLIETFEKYPCHISLAHISMACQLMNEPLLKFMFEQCSIPSSRLYQLIIETCPYELPLQMLLDLKNEVEPNHIQLCIEHNKPRFLKLLLKSINDLSQYSWLYKFTLETAYQKSSMTLLQKFDFVQSMFQLLCEECKVPLGAGVITTCAMLKQPRYLKIVCKLMQTHHRQELNQALVCLIHSPMDELENNSWIYECIPSASWIDAATIDVAVVYERNYNSSFAKQLLFYYENNLPWYYKVRDMLRLF